MAKYKNKFSDKRYSVGGFISLFLGISSFVILVMAVVMSYKAKGNGGTIVGTYGFTALVTAFFGCVVGAVSYNEPNRYYTFSFIGTLVSGILTVFMIFLLLVGI